MIDLRSDTVTKPTLEMRNAMFHAEVGDDVYGEDPTVNQLEQIAAEMVGKEAALFVTSGTQGNQLAVLSQCSPGDEIIVEAESHIFFYEGGAISALAGVQPRTVKGINGAIQTEDLKKAIRSNDIHFPDTALICVENTHNRSGGSVISLENMQNLYEIAKSRYIPVHLDGARIFNAAAYAQVPVSSFAAYCDTIQFCLSKGLGSPAGSILAGDKKTIAKARKWRKRLGGGMRQAGILAASGIVSLTTMTERLREDHEKALFLAESLRDIATLSIENSVDTNIVIVNIEKTGLTPDKFTANLKSEGILAGAFGDKTIRLATHYDVSFEEIKQALLKVEQIVKRG